VVPINNDTTYSHDGPCHTENDRLRVTLAPMRRRQMRTRGTHDAAKEARCARSLSRAQAAKQQASGQRRRKRDACTSK